MQASKRHTDFYGCSEQNLLRHPFFQSRKDTLEDFGLHRHSVCNPVKQSGLTPSAWFELLVLNTKITRHNTNTGPNLPFTQLSQSLSEVCTE